MAKKRTKARPKKPTSEDGNDQQQEEVGWASIPGKRLKVDIADTSAAAVAGRGDASDDDDDEFNTDKWMSQHYDEESDNDQLNQQADADLFDPDPHAKTNKYDAGSKLEGANDDGMFMSLEVIPADAYRVEKTGDEKSGFITKVVFTKDQSEANKASPADTKSVKDSDKKPPHKKKEKSKAVDEASDNDGEASDKKPQATRYDEEWASLPRKERQKLKRKARREEAKERKRLKKEGADKTSSSHAATKGSKSASSKDASDAADDTSNQEDQLAITQLQTTWSISAPGVSLHNTLCKGLHTLNYTYPTPIQSSTLPAAILGRRDIVGAAPTGSGKTLSYGLPILQHLLDTIDANAADVAEDSGASSSNQSKKQEKLPLQALILTPTRELAIQVTDELQKVCCKSIPIGTIVGGFAEVKQRRTLEKVRPPILVGTPGRLWELMSGKEYSHLNNLSELRFLVIDEADRMIKQGSFPQLQQIFEVINQANPPPEDPNDLEDESESDDDEDRMRGLQGIRGEAKVVMLDDSILAAIDRERNGVTERPAPMEMDDDEFEHEQHLLDDEDESDSDDEEDSVEPVHRQTFVYSATLTLPPSMHHLIKKDPAVQAKLSKKKKGKTQAATVDGEIANILDVSGARGETKIVDLSNTIPEGKKSKSQKKDEAGKDKKGKNDSSAVEESTSVGTRLPPGLTLGEVRCAQRHKDSHLYAYLVTTRQGSSGPCLVFCNSIAAVRRVGETLKTLGLPVKMLHAQMTQKSRLGALESLRTSNSRSIVVASDVAARGLDISSVTTVVHYDVARVVDTFIHRAGRTARGVGEKAVGTSISLVAPAEEKEHLKICEAVRGSGIKSLEQVHIDGRLLNEAQERVALATKIVSCNDVESQASKKNKWLQDAAKDAGLEVDEDMMESGLLDGDHRDRQRFLEAKRAKIELRQLLAKPMRKQHFGKFLSGAGLRESIKAEDEVKPFVVKATSKKRHRKKKKPKN
jgi:ATP-dependent RNA helicase DDX24/MAK5